METMQNIMNTRSLNWEDCANVRDLGGLPLLGGKYTQWRKVIRADFPGQLTEKAWQALAEVGVKTIIDLRGPVEAEKESYAIPQQFSIDYCNCPMEKFLPEVSALINKAQNRAEVYCIILDHYPDLIAEVLRKIASVENGAVLIHCQAGKDRTGTISALLLDLAGVPHDWIAADYAESQIRLHDLYERTLAEAGSEENLGFWSRPTATTEMMVLMLKHIQQRYGSTAAYMHAAGLSEEEVTRLKQKLSEL